ncbi:MAG: hypothetical protein NTV34_08015 [Proteobacteria bacterium]|nr:hypothetical protein [Pseudomonadota bacterium]
MNKLLPFFFLVLSACRGTQSVEDSSALAANSGSGKVYKIELTSLVGTHKVDLPEVPASVIFSFPKLNETPEYGDNNGYGGISCSKQSLSRSQLAIAVKVKSDVINQEGFCDKVLGSKLTSATSANLLIDHSVRGDKLFGNLVSHFGPQYFYLQRPELLIAKTEMAKIKLISGDCTQSTSGSAHFAFKLGSSDECIYEYDSNSARAPTGVRQRIILKELSAT